MQKKIIVIGALKEKPNKVCFIGKAVKKKNEVALTQIGIALTKG
mgnify:CR=1 FL=1